MVEELKPRRAGKAAGPRPRGGRGSSMRWLPALIFFGVFMFILTQEVPAVRTHVDRFINPDAYAAVSACQEAVVGRADREGTARVVQPGNANKTQSGFYVDGIVLGEMGEGGRERRTRFGCYTDASGGVISAEPVSSTETQ